MSPEKMAELYTEDLWSVQDIALEAGVALATVCERLDELGVQRRPRGESKRIFHMKAAQREERRFVVPLSTDCRCLNPIKRRKYGGRWWDLRCGRFV